MHPRDLATLEFPRVLDAIARLTRSAAGREAALAVRPVTDVDDVSERLDTMAELVAYSAEAGPPPTGDLPLLGPLLTAAMPEGAALEPARLLEARTVVAAGRRLGVYLRRDVARLPRLAALADGLPDLRGLERSLIDTLDDAGQIRDDASPTLAAARAATRELRREMEGRLERLIREPAMADIVAESYVTLRGGRFVVPIRVAAASQVPGVIQDRSASGETVFVEPLFAVELNNRLLLALKDEEAEEWRVRAELTGLVRELAPALETLEQVLASMEALAAAATFAARHGCTRPTLDTTQVRLVAARHPLLLETGRPVVPLELRLPADRRGLAITGPNAGGKTVALKTLGLSIAMAQAGLFIPAAEGSRLPVVTALLVDIGDEQSIERDLSTFSGHVENLARIVAAADDGALVLLDEPGAGTDPTEGAALAVGLLTDLLTRGPRVAFTSHFPQVKMFALATPELDVAAFDVDPATGAPQFRLAYHTVGQSFALPIARRHGLPARTLETAERVLAGESHDLARAIARLEESRAAYETLRVETEEEGARLAAARAEAAALVADLEERKRQRWVADLETAGSFLRELRAEGQALLEELRTRPDPKALRRFVREAEAQVRAREATLGGDHPTGRAPTLGDTVEVAGRGIRGELVEIAGERSRIQRGGLRFEVATDQLRLVDGPVRRARVSVAVETPADGAEEINLIGRRARDAVAELERFLDRAVRAGVGQVRVVHGVGTGALRRAVQEFLAGSSYCASYRDAEPESGGGVTIAELA